MALISRNMSPYRLTYGVVCDCMLGYIYIYIYIYIYMIDSATGINRLTIKFWILYWVIKKLNHC